MVTYAYLIELSPPQRRAVIAELESRLRASGKPELDREAAGALNAIYRAMVGIDHPDYVRAYERS